MSRPEPQNKHPAKRHLLRWIVTGVLLAGLLLALHGYQTRGVARGLAPEFQGRLLDGQPVSMQAFRGRPVLLHFWASWCPVCALQQASIDRIARDHAVLTVALDDAATEEIREWMRSRGVAYPVLHDAQGRIAGRFGVRGVPTSVVIDARGEIRFVEVGYTSEAGLRLRLWWVDS
ncbi:MAG: protein disulfide oxidoreductase [Gammaproteobacteria bacterium]|nr:MAG: protein disulfide oxidoreductase [Gammaproteobacteria bacterium]